MLVHSKIIVFTEKKNNHKKEESQGGKWKVQHIPIFCNIYELSFCCLGDGQDDSMPEA